MFLPPVESSFYRPASENKNQCRQKLSNYRNKNQVLYPKSISHRNCVKNWHFKVHVQVISFFRNRLLPNEEKSRWCKWLLGGPDSFFPITGKRSKYFRRIMGAHLAVKWSRLQGRNSFIYSRGLRSFVSITFFSFSLRNESLHENILFHIIVSEGWNISFAS